MKYIFISAFISFLIGILFFAWYHEFVLICFDRQTRFQPMVAQQETITVWYFKAPNWHQEQQVIIADDNRISYVHKMIEQWVSALFNNGLLYKKISIQSVTFNATGSDLYISFERSPLHQQQSTQQKIMFINGLCKTLQENGVKAQRIHLLVQHAYVSDPHVLCNYGLPITGFTPSKLSASSHK